MAKTDPETDVIVRVAPAQDAPLFRLTAEDNTDAPKDNKKGDE